MWKDALCAFSERWSVVHEEPSDVEIMKKSKESAGVLLDSLHLRFKLIGIEEPPPVPILNADGDINHNDEDDDDADAYPNGYPPTDSDDDKDDDTIVAAAEHTHTIVEEKNVKTKAKKKQPLLSKTAQNAIKRLYNMSNQSVDSLLLIYKHTEERR